MNREDQLKRFMQERVYGFYNGFNLSIDELVRTEGNDEKVLNLLDKKFRRFLTLNKELNDPKMHFEGYLLDCLDGLKRSKRSDIELTNRIVDSITRYFEHRKEPQPEPWELMAEVKELREAIEDKPENWTIEEQIVCLHELGIIQALHDKNPSSINAIAKALAPALNRKVTSLQPKLNTYFSQEEQSKILTPERVEKVKAIIKGARIDSIK